ncbi:MAG: PP2C family serine/threonine-protein phosphatase [Armatimonadota bacterium]
MQSTASTGTPASQERCWRVAGVSEQGVSHLKRRQPCQDAHLWRELPGGAIIIAVADGAGSASLAQVGSARAAVASVEWASQLMNEGWPTNEAEWRGLLNATMQTAHESVVASAEKRTVSSRELATTLILTIATPEIVAVLQVGDGAVVLNDAEKHLFALTVPQSGEFINETIFFTSPHYLDAAQFNIYAGSFSGIGVMSDGLQMLALRMPGAQPHPAFFNPLFRMMHDADDEEEATRHLRSFLESDRIRDRSDDDLTLVLATRTPV